MLVFTSTKQNRILYQVKQIKAIILDNIGYCKIKFIYLGYEEK